ncbi:MAG TPA: hypothetical protein VFX02_06295 [Gammaproteobacteria bacterium]|nr:hypothetical protein [Gammaproteobacteria bacterium]
MNLKIMNSLILMSILACQSALAENQAVSRWNLDLSPSLFDVDNEGNGLDLLTEMTFPLAPILGMGVFIDGSFTSGNDDNSDAIGSGLGAEIFLGRHDIGRIGFGVASTSTVYTDIYDDEYSVEDDPTISSDLKTVSGEAYLGDFTLFAANTKAETELESDGFTRDYPEQDRTVYGLQYYPTDRMSLMIGKYKEEETATAEVFVFGQSILLEYEREAESTFLGAEFQTGRIVSIFMKYQQTEYDDGFGTFFADNSEKIKSLFVGVSIYIRGGETLKENDRWY